MAPASRYRSLGTDSLFVGSLPGRASQLRCIGEYEYDVVGCSDLNVQ